MENNTSAFIKLVDEMMSSNEHYFLQLIEMKKNDLNVKGKVYADYNLKYGGMNVNDWNEFDFLLKEYIVGFNAQDKITKDVLENTTKQLEIDFLSGNITKEKALLYISLSDGINYYGLYKGSGLPSFSNLIFWRDLLKMLYVRNLLNQSYYSSRCDENAYKIEGFDDLPNLVIAVKLIEEKISEIISFKDGIVCFTEGQEERIVSKIEKKLRSLNLFQGLRLIFSIYENEKRKNRIEKTLPYKYIINMMVKNIAKSNHKISKNEKIINVFELMNAFISLYQLKESRFAIAGISNANLTQYLRKQVLYSNFYPIYPLKNETLIEYIKGIVEPNIKIDMFREKFGFSFNELISFFKFIGMQVSDVLVLEKETISEADAKIVDFFSIDADVINKNYSSMSSLIFNENIFALNPVVKYKRKFYLVGYKYFKLNFYNALLEKIRREFDKEINSKIGGNIDNLVENIFKSLQKKNKFEVFSGRYTPPKKENPESDLLIKSDNDLILIENKNKYLTRVAFSGDEPEILKDFILSFGFSQKQLFNHEKNIRLYKQIKFEKDNKTLQYDGQNIIKISISTNNWYSIMNNPSSLILPAVTGLTFDVEPDSVKKGHKDFMKANKYLDELNALIEGFRNKHPNEINKILTQTVFLPLELIVDKYKDESFITIIKLLISTKMNTDNIMNVYDYCKFLKSQS
ncbi:hypothetical protein [Pantoea agglomerans]|uniref:hypothetical protein n=1 Tax=Enterobacter agglomerans TaxID=549 RepID=UPI0016542B90|nr:hypothetical protein [Pantoea agglomerans]